MTNTRAAASLVPSRREWAKERRRLRRLRLVSLGPANMPLATPLRFYSTAVIVPSQVALPTLAIILRMLLRMPRHLCSACSSLLIRPNCNPETQQGAILTDPDTVLYRLPGDVRHARGVCFICTLVTAAFRTIEQHSVTEWICGFKMAMCWSTRGHFGSIDVVPLDNNNRPITWHGSHHGILLSPVDGIVLRPYSASMRLMS